MNLEYTNVVTYPKTKLSKLCDDGLGSRLVFNLEQDSWEQLGNFSGDTTLDLFEDGSIGIMRTIYVGYEEGWMEKPLEYIRPGTPRYTEIKNALDHMLSIWPITRRLPFRMLTSVDSLLKSLKEGTL